MPKNLKGGNRAKKGKNSALRVESKLELVTEGQMYGICSKYYGNHRGDVLYYTKINEDGVMVDKEVNAMGIIRGAIRRRTRLRAGDILIVAPRDFQLDKVDIIHVYKFEDAKKLKKAVSLHPKILSNYESLNNIGESENIDESFSFENLDDENFDIGRDGFNKPTNKSNKSKTEHQSYASIYAGMPSYDDFDEEDEDELADI
jgi:initiation factor 1A